MGDCKPYLRMVSNPKRQFYDLTFFSFSIENARNRPMLLIRNFVIERQFHFLIKIKDLSENYVKRDILTEFHNKRRNIRVEKKRLSRDTKSFVT